jgi:type IV fimbrial biogenesis protein FimT
MQTHCPMPNHTRSPRRLSGFTLLELLVTMFVAAIILGVAVPSFRTMTASNRITTQTNDLIGAVNFARSQAITRNGNVTLCRTAAAADTTCAAVAGDWQNWIIRNTAGTVVRNGSVPVYGGTLRVTSDLTADSMVFGSDGLARTTAGVLISNQRFTVCTTLSMPENVRRVTLGAASRVTVTKLTVGC